MTLNGPLNLGMNLAMCPSFTCMYSHQWWAVARSTQLPILKVGSGAQSLLAWWVWLILAAVNESLASRRSSASWLMTMCAVSSPSEVGLVLKVLQGAGVLVVCTTLFSGVIKGGIKHGECADLSMKGENPVKAFMVFIILK